MTDTLSTCDSVTPAFLGLPRKFTSFRPAQTEALDYASCHAYKPFTALGLPTGSGKSLLAVAIAKTLGAKAVYLTATKALQDQVSREFAECGMVDMRGWSNYPCGQLYRERRNPTCEYGHTHECDLQRTGHCPRHRAMESAKQSDLIVTNYACWLHSRRYDRDAFGREGRPVELLICDEAGEIPEIVSSFVSVKIKHTDEELPFPAPFTGVDRPSGLMPSITWSNWARERRALAMEQAVRIRESYRTLANAMKNDRFVYLKQLIEICERIPTLDSNWVWEVDKDGVTFQPVWPGPLTSCLWSGVSRVLLLSATLRPYTLGLCGLRKEDYDFREWPAVFLPQYGPFYHLPVLKLNWKSTEEDYAAVIAVMDQCLDARNDRRTLIHTGSYERARMIKKCSRHVFRMFFNESGRDAADKADEYRRGPENSVLVGPSYTTGINLPGRECEFQIIIKCPYPDTTSRVMAERCKNSGYLLQQTIERLIQINGRPRRFQIDRAETVILDNAVRWLTGGPRNPWHGHAPSWFRMQTISQLPPAPPRVNEL